MIKKSRKTSKHDKIEICSIDEGIINLTDVNLRKKETLDGRFYACYMH
jgi:hypothetical protein